jgi:type VI secretion system protein ImpI
MTITLTIDSVDSLPDGGPIRFQARNRGFEIGRQQHLDWTLPDPGRHISGLHCDVRFEKGGYWLYDVSRNGTFLNGSTARMKSPHRLASGDRLAIGHYVIRVEVEDEQASDGAAEDPFQQARQDFSTPSDDIWGAGEPAPPPIDRRELIARPAGRRRDADFSQQFIAFPGTPSQPARPDPYAADAGSAQPAPPFVPAARSQPEPAPSHPAPVFQPAPTDPAPARAKPQPAAGESFAPGQPAAASAPAAPFAPQAFPPPPGPVPAADQQAFARFLQGLAAGAGVTPDTFAERDPAEIGQEVGEFLRVATEQLAQLLRARAAAKAMTKSASRTMIGAADNNPLKFIPTAAEAIDVMFSRRRPGFLGARASLEAGFADLKRHELATYAAMQKALDRLLDELSPDTISAKVGNSAFSSRKSRSWELFVERWEQKSGPHDNGMLDVFFGYFAEAYDEANKKG